MRAGTLSRPGEPAPASLGRGSVLPDGTPAPRENPPTSAPRRPAGLAVLVALLAALFAAAFAAAGTAGAHSGAVSSVPEDGSTVEVGPARASITFNEELQKTFPSLTVVGPDGRLWSKGEVLVEGPTVSVEVGELGPVGEYTLAFRVTSADGHPVSGTRHFTLSKEGTGTAGAQPGADSADGGGGDSGGVPVWVFVAGGVVLFGAGLAVALLGGRSGRKE
ncbi:copper resistance CopC family protein [Nocardia mangyaensis]|uniref:copper resistance CopC family protein n=1 Tax=Nocardia mangyaensis TaxID=2213200 RepID=UPI0026762D7A|nr:copper resistance CopC family protein [Nocardia mangyaensis]MDO3647517.1 copper resistance protein CopC [Nocardia mangyaensis]